jgi:isocitrate dehydrogenase
MSKTPITVIYGDGIGPEITKACLQIIEAAGANIDIKPIYEIGEKSYLAGYTSGIKPKDWETILSTRAILKAPITTPQGGGYKSLNVSIRKSLGLFCNLRPCKSYHPFVKTHFANIDIVIFRENEEDLYAGIEHREGIDAYVCTKLITKTGSEKIIREAFEYARKNKRKKVTCMTKDNIMKMADGIFHKTFVEIGAEYQDIEQEHMIIDIGSARLANKPDHFDVVVTLNLYGDIISDIVAEVSGSVGFAGSANIGNKYAMFEAIHGSAPLLAGKNGANPSGMLNGAILMLCYIGQGSVATKVENALLKTIEDGFVTKDLYQEGLSKKLCGTDEFAQCVIANLGKKPSKIKEATAYPDFAFNNDTKEDKTIPHAIFSKEEGRALKTIIGFDAFIDKPCLTKDIAEMTRKIDIKGLSLKTISSRGLLLYSKEEMQDVFASHWRLRFMSASPLNLSHGAELLQALASLGLDVARFSTLYNYDGKAGYTLEQSE